MRSIPELLDSLTPDPWRDEVGFSADLDYFNKEILETDKSDAEISANLRKWLASPEGQPCLFGRMAAGPLDLLSFCILTEADLRRGDRFTKEKIQTYRLLWKIEALQGKRSGFIIVAIAPHLVTAQPNDTLKEFALKLCMLYLREDIEPDQIHTDRLTLKIPSDGEQPAERYEWYVGANYFSPQGDKRWWHDHRFPGGVAFSMNSVGHMTRNGSLRKMAVAHAKSSGIAPPVRAHGIDSLGNALKFAMFTIGNAYPTASGKATWLHKRSAVEYEALTPKCPFADSTPDSLKLMDYKTYSGWYHTDVTVPSDYFDPAVTRPVSVKEKPLDFTYLFDDSVDNPAYDTMGLGGRIP